MLDFIGGVFKSVGVAITTIGVVVTGVFVGPENSNNVEQKTTLEQGVVENIEQEPDVVGEERADTNIIVNNPQEVEVTEDVFNQAPAIVDQKKDRETEEEKEKLTNFSARCLLSEDSIFEGGYVEADLKIYEEGGSSGLEKDYEISWNYTDLDEETKDGYFKFNRPGGYVITATVIRNEDGMTEVASCGEVDVDEKKEKVQLSEECEYALSKFIPTEEDYNNLWEHIQREELYERDVSEEYERLADIGLKLMQYRSDVSYWCN